MCPQGSSCPRTAPSLPKAPTCPRTWAPPCLERGLGAGTTPGSFPFAARLVGTLSEFRGSWLGDTSPRRPREGDDAKRGENDLIEAVVETLEASALGDARIDQERLRIIGSHELALLCWHEVRDSAREGAASRDSLSLLIKLALYRQ